MMRRVLIVYKVQDADVKPTELSQIAGGGIANKSLDKERRYLALTPLAPSHLVWRS
jgi:hypothetical protein